MPGQTTIEPCGIPDLTGRRSYVAPNTVVCDFQDSTETI